MQTSRNVGVTALLLGAFLLLSGCGTSDTNPTATPADVSEPLFASEEEALAAAEEAFGAYLDMTNLIGKEGNVNPERIAPFVTNGWLPTEIAGFTDPATSGRRQIGDATFDSAALQQVIDGPDETLVIVTLCLDLRARSSLDASGAVVQLEEVPKRLLLEVSLTPNPEKPEALLVERLEPWPREHC